MKISLVKILISNYQIKCKINLTCVFGGGDLLNELAAISNYKKLIYELV